jgi:hypothetical protein
VRLDPRRYEPRILLTLLTLLTLVTLAMSENWWRAKMEH